MFVFTSVYVPLRRNATSLILGTHFNICTLGVAGGRGSYARVNLVSLVLGPCPPTRDVLAIITKIDRATKTATVINGDGAFTFKRSDTAYELNTATRATHAHVRQTNGHVGLMMREIH